MFYVESLKQTHVVSSKSFKYILSRHQITRSIAGWHHIITREWEGTFSSAIICTYYIVIKKNIDRKKGLFCWNNILVGFVQWLLSWIYKHLMYSAVYVWEMPILVRGERSVWRSGSFPPHKQRKLLCLILLKHFFLVFIFT